MDYLTIKTLHLFFVVSWFAGLFYLPRLFVNLALATDNERPRLLLMSKKLLRFMLPLVAGVLIFGVWLMFSIPISGGWLHAKLTLVACLLAYHFYCFLLLRQFERNQNKHGHVWFRWFNEVPALMLLIILWLAIAKPF